MYPRCITYLLLYFDLWGFSTHFQTSQLTRYRFIFAFHIIVASISTFWFVQFMRRPNNDQLGTFNDTFKLTGVLSVYWLSILELNFKQQIQRRFWIIVRKIDKEFCSHKNLRFRSYNLKMIIYFIVFALMYVNYFAELFRFNGSDLYGFWVCSAFVMIFYRKHMFYYLFYLEIVKHQLKMIDYEMSSMKCVCQSGKMKVGKVFRTFHHKRLKWFRDYYNSIYDLGDAINTIFGWSNAAAIGIAFGQILADTFWFYWKILNKYEIDVIGNNSAHNNLSMKGGSFPQ